MGRWTYVLICAAALVAAACGSPGDEPGDGTQASRVNSVGRELPADAAPLSEQFIRLSMLEPSTLDVGISLFDAQFNAFLFESLLVFDEDMETQGRGRRVLVRGGRPRDLDLQDPARARSGATAGR